MADNLGGRMLGTNMLQSAIDKFSSAIDKMSSAYGSAKPAAQNAAGKIDAAWTGNPNGGGGLRGLSKGNYTSKAAGVGAAFGALATYGNEQLDKQLPMDEYVYNASLGMTGNLSTNQAALRRQAFGQNNQNLNALAVNSEDAAQMYSRLGQVAGTPMLNQTSAGQTIQQSVNTIGVINPYMTGSQDASVVSNIYSSQTALASAKMGFLPTRQPGTGQPQSLNAIASNIITQSFNGRTPTMKELNATFGEGGKTRLNMQYAGYNQASINAVANVARVQSKVQSAGGSAQEAQQLIDQASHGDTRAQSTLQQKYGVARSDSQSLKNLESARTGRTADTSSSFNEGIQDSTDTLQKFSKAFTTFMNQSGLTNLLGTGGAWASQINSSLSGFSGGVAGAAGMMGGVNAARGLTGKISSAGSATFSNLGARFTPYTGAALGTAGKVGAAALVAGGIYGVGRTVGTKQGRKEASSRADVFAQTRGNAEWLKKHGTLLEKSMPSQMAAVNRWQSGASGWTEEALHSMGSFFGIDTDTVPTDWGGTGDTNQRSTTGTGIGGGDSGGAQKALKWAESVSKKHLKYQYGGNGNPSWDCSGFMSAIESVIRGEKPHRRWATTAFNQYGNHKGPSGWKFHQKAAFMVGVEGTSGPNAHTAGTLLGHNVESNGSGGPRVDRNGARGYKDPLFHGKWWGFIPSGKGNGGAADPGGNTDQAEEEDDTPDAAGFGFGDEYGSSEEATTLMSILSGGTGFDNPTSVDKDVSDPKQGSEDSPDNQTGANLGKNPNLKNKQQYYDFAKQEMERQGLSVSYNWPSLKALWEGESNWNPRADNPNSDAYGIPQALPGSKMGKGWKTDAAVQIRWGIKYIKQRYKNPANAYRIWKSRHPHWYWTGTEQAVGKDRRTAKGDLKKLKEMPKPAQSLHRVIDKNDLLGKNNSSKPIQIDLSDGAITINVAGNLANGQDAKNVASMIAEELAKLDLYQKVMR